MWPRQPAKGMDRRADFGKLVFWPSGRNPREGDKEGMGGGEPPGVDQLPESFSNQDERICNTSWKRQGDFRIRRVMAASRKGSCPGKKVCERVREGTGVEGNKRRNHPPRGRKDVYKHCWAKRIARVEYSPWASARCLSWVFVLEE